MHETKIKSCSTGTQQGERSVSQDSTYHSLKLCGSMQERVQKIMRTIVQMYVFSDNSIALWEFIHGVS